MARLIKTNGEQIHVKPKGDTWSLDELRKLIGRYIKTVELPSGESLVVNEDGMALKLPPNHVATLMVAKSIGPGERVVGDCLVLSQTEKAQKDHREDE